MRHDCDCDCGNDNVGIFDHIYTGDDIIPWALDYPIRQRYGDYPNRNEEKSSGSSLPRNWNLNLHAFFSKAFRIARVLPLVGVAIAAIVVVINALV